MINKLGFLKAGEHLCLEAQASLTDGQQQMEDFVFLHLSGSLKLSQLDLHLLSSLPRRGKDPQGTLLLLNPQNCKPNLFRDA